MFVYAIIPAFQSSYFHRAYAAYSGIFIIMAITWGWIFERIVPDVIDVIDVIGAVIAIVGVMVIFYMPIRSIYHCLLQVY